MKHMRAKNPPPCPPSLCLGAILRIVVQNELRILHLFRFSVWGLQSEVALVGLQHGWRILLTCSGNAPRSALWHELMIIS